MNGPNLLTSNHPSYGVEHAWFLFSIGNPISRLLLTEAKNRHAVELIETLYAQGKISSVKLLTVHRDCDIAIRSELVEDIQFVDFILDIVDTEAQGQEPVTTVFPAALTPGEQQYAMMKLDAATQLAQKQSSNVKTPSRSPVRGVPRALNAKPADEPMGFELEVKRDKLVSALESLGFKKAQVNGFVSSIKNRLAKEPVEALLTEGIRTFTKV